MIGLALYFLGVGLGIAIGWSMRAQRAYAHLAAGFHAMAAVYHDGREPSAHDIVTAFSSKEKT